MTLHSVTGHRDGPLPLTMGKRGPLFPLRVFRHGKEAVHDTLRDVSVVALPLACFLQRTQARQVVTFY